MWRRSQRFPARLIERAVALTRPRQAVYCTCSLEPEENEAVIADLLAHHDDVRRAPICAADVFAEPSSLPATATCARLPCHLPMLIRASPGSMASTPLASKKSNDINEMNVSLAAPRGFGYMVAPGGHDRPRTQERGDRSDGARCSRQPREAVLAPAARRDAAACRAGGWPSLLRGRCFRARPTGC